MTQNNTHHDQETPSKDQAQKIQSLREMIQNAERTIQGAKAMLLQLEGKKKVGRKRKVEEVTDGTVVEGVFDGQIMVGNDGKQYPVPANYASKSKLVEGDILKLTIAPEGSFIYKQIGPAERKHALGIVSQDEAGNYYIVAEGKPYRVLLASVTYFKAEPGDEVAIVLPRDTHATWAAIENILQKGSLHPQWMPPKSSKKDTSSNEEDWKSELHDETEASSQAHSTSAPHSNEEIIDEWAKDLEEIEKEMKASE